MHLDDDALVGFVGGDVSPEENARIEEHLDACRACRKLVSALAESPAGDRSSGPPTVSATRLPGFTMVLDDRFECGDLAGSGGMGHVYDGRDRTTGARVAIKIVQTTETLDHERFEREVDVLRSLDHPSIVRYVANGLTPRGAPYLVMEWLEGETLSKRLTRGPLEIEETVDVGIAVADALAAVHARGVVHRDLKPSNLWLQAGANFQVKLIDFGLAFQKARKRRLTAIGAILGTPGFMAPEQVLSDADVDHRTDLFALGCVLFQCLSGRTAFGGDNVLSVLLKTVLEEAPTLQVATNIPEPLRALLGSLMAKSPSERPRDASAIANELRAVRALIGLPSGEPASRARWIGAGERRVTALVLARLHSLEDMETTIAEDELREIEQTLGDVAADHGGRLEILPGGLVAIALSPSGPPTDLAARAAQCALALEARMRGVPVVVACGREDASAHERTSELVDRCVSLFGTERRAAVLIDQTMASLLGGRYDVTTERGALVLRGETFGARTLLGESIECIGRDRELALLEATFDECVTDDVARGVLVTGPPGVGKSRLWRELSARLRSAGKRFSLWLGRGDPLRPGAPLAAIADALGSHFELAAGESLAGRHRKIAAHVAARLSGEEGARVNDFMAELAGAPLSPLGRPELIAARKDPLLRADQIRRAFLAYLHAECSVRPVILVLEDLQWGDHATIDLVDHALRALKGKPFFAIGLARPEVHESLPKAFADRAVTELRLGELSAKASERLARRVLGMAAPDHVVERIVARADGNAFYLEELLRAEASGREGELPESVVAMAQARLNDLDETARRVLRAASVYGVDFQVRGVAALAGDVAPARVERILVDLSAREIITRIDRRAIDEPLYAFRHDLLREAAYASLPERDRTLGHRLAAKWLEQRGDVDPETLAQHLELGGAPDRAAPWYRRAAERSFDASDFGGAIARADRSLACGASDKDAAELDLLKAKAYRFAGLRKESVAGALAALKLLREGSASYYAALGEIATSARASGDPELLVECANVLLASRPEESARSARALAMSRFVIHLLLAGRRDLADTVLAALQTDEHPAADDATVRAALCQLRASRAAMIGDIAEFLGAALETARERALLGDLRQLAYARVLVGYALLRLGAFREAEAELRETLALTERLQLTSYGWQAMHYLGLAVASLGRHAEGRAIEEQAVESALAQGDGVFGAACRHYVALIQLLENDPAGAKATIESTDFESRTPALAYGLAALAEAELMLGAPQRALDHARAGVDLLAQLRVVDVSDAPCRLALAKALIATGHHDEARACLDAARRMIEGQAERIGDAHLKRSYLEDLRENAEILALCQTWLG